MTYSYATMRPAHIAGARFRGGISRLAMGSLDYASCIAEPGADPDVCATMYPGQAEIEMPPMDVSKAGNASSSAGTAAASPALASLASHMGVSPALLLVGTAAGLGALYYFTRKPKRST